MTIKILMILILLSTSLASGCECINDSWMVGHHAIILVAGTFVDNWYNVTIQNVSNGFVLVSGCVSTNKDLTITNKWINKNFIWTISGL